jgi:hypothetical protein
LIFEKPSSTNWIFNLQKSISKLIFAGYTGSKNPVRNIIKIQFLELDFSNLIFQKIRYKSTGGKTEIIYPENVRAKVAIDFT